MIRGEITVRVPNPHQGDIGKDLLGKILGQAGISKEEWEKLQDSSIALTRRQGIQTKKPGPKKKDMYDVRGIPNQATWRER